MRISWKEQLKSRPDLHNFDKWPYIDMALIDKRKRKTFIRNKNIVALVLNDVSYLDICKRYSVTPGTITNIMNRCLSSNDNEDPVLTEALIPHHHIKRPIRKNILSKFGNISGARCSFQYVLDNVKGIKEQLDKVISSKIKDQPYAQNLKPKWFHSEFLRLLEQAKWPRDTYPYTEEYQGYESARQYFHERVGYLKMSKFGNRSYKYRDNNYSNRFKALREVQLDEQLYHGSGSITILLDEKYSTARLSRMSLVLAIDVDTDCYLGYVLALTGHPSQEDVLNGLKNIYRSWNPRKIVTPELKYPPMAGFPSGVIDEFSSLAIEEFSIDNALAHLANSVKHFVCDTLCATLNFGRPGRPQRRNWIEAAFKMASEFSHRFPSTTGSHVLDPKKETQKNFKMPPVVSLKILEDCLDVILATHNCSAQARLGGRSPLEEIRHQMTTHRLRCLPDHITKPIIEAEDSAKVIIRWLKNENRAPHITFLKVRYQGHGINDAELEGKEILVKYPSHDIRVLRAYTLSGQYLGKLHAPLSWQKFPHTIKTRRQIFKHCRKQNRHYRDPLSGFFAYLLENKHIPKEALEMVRVYREFTFNNSVELQLGEDAKEKYTVDPEYPDPQDSNRVFPDWTPTLSLIPTTNVGE